MPLLGKTTDTERLSNVHALLMISQLILVTAIFYILESLASQGKEVPLQQLLLVSEDILVD